MDRANGIWLVRFGIKEPGGVAHDLRIMKSERQKMLSGELYDPLDPELMAARARCRDICRRLNHTTESQKAERTALLRELFGEETSVWLEPPFHCDYGTNITLGSKVFFNFNCVVLDVMPVSIGDNVLFGPAVQIYSAMHPIVARERSAGLEYGRPVKIGSDVWVAGGAIICPGVTIGDRTVIGAGSVVTRDIPSDSVAVGNPAKVVRQISV